MLDTKTDEPTIEELLRSIREAISNKMTDENLDQNKHVENAASTDEKSDVNLVRADEEEAELELTQMVDEKGEIIDLKAESEASTDGAATNILDVKPEPIKPEETKLEAKVESQPIKTEEVKFEPEITAPATPVTSETQSDKTLDPVTDLEDRDEDDKNAASRLISEDSAKSSSEALKDLIRTVAKPSSDGLAFRSGSTLEDLVKEIIRPQLSLWLDNNLPSIVRNIVEKEVRKLIPRDDE